LPDLQRGVQVSFFRIGHQRAAVRFSVRRSTGGPRQRVQERVGAAPLGTFSARCNRQMKGPSIGPDPTLIPEDQRAEESK